METDFLGDFGGCYNGKTDFADLRMETDFLGIFCGNPVPFRKKNPFPSVNPQNPFYHSILMGHLPLKQPQSFHSF
jgi:hypothetical protein